MRYPIFFIVTMFIISQKSSFLFAQGKYEKFNVIRVLVYQPRPGTCYNPAPGFGHYPCIVISMGVLVRNSEGGGESSICCTDYKLDGSFIKNVQTDFGKYAPQGFQGIQSAIGNVTISSSLVLDQHLKSRLQAFADALNQFKNSWNLAQKPEDLYYYTASLALYDLSEAFLKSNASSAEKLSFIDAHKNVSSTLFEISSKGLLNVGTTFTPFINDARDAYELINGRDLITGEEISGFGRVLTAVALIAGNGNLYRKAAEQLKESFFKKALTESLPGIPKLKYTGSGGWVSESGIVYRRSTNKYENNLRHVLKHCTPDPARPNHTVFNLRPKEVPSLLDEAWKKRGTALNDPRADVYVVDMNRTIGTKGEKNIRLIFQKGTNNIITAYPQ